MPETEVIRIKFAPLPEGEAYITQDVTIIKGDASGLYQAVLAACRKYQDEHGLAGADNAPLPNTEAPPSE